MSRIFEALNITPDEVTSKIEPLSCGPGQPVEDSSELLPTTVTPAETDVFRGLPDQVAELPRSADWSHKKIRKYLVLAFFAMGLVLLGSNYAFRPLGNAFGKHQSVYGVAFEGAVHPASEVRITAAASGMVSDISAKVGDTVQQGQQLLRMDDREAELGVKQAGVELEAAKTKLDKFRVQLADANARMAIAQRQAELLPSRQWRDSPQRAAAAYDQALLNYNRAKEMFDAGLIARQELDARSTELRIAQDDLDNAKKLAAVSAKLTRDQEQQAHLQEKVTREELQEQLSQAEVNYERAKEQADATIVRATTAGVISEVPVRLGDRVSSGAVLTRLAKLDRMVVEVAVAAPMISELRVGQRAQVELSSLPPREVAGTIRAISPLPSQNMTHAVEVEFDNPTLMLVAGQPAEVRFMRP